MSPTGYFSIVHIYIIPQLTPKVKNYLTPGMPLRCDICQWPTLPSDVKTRQTSPGVMDAKVLDLPSPSVNVSRRHDAPKMIPIIGLFFGAGLPDRRSNEMVHHSPFFGRHGFSLVESFFFILRSATSTYIGSDDSAFKGRYKYLYSFGRWRQAI